MVSLEESDGQDSLRPREQGYKGRGKYRGEQAAATHGIPKAAGAKKIAGRRFSSRNANSRGVKKPARSNDADNTPLDRHASARTSDATENESGISRPLDTKSAGYSTNNASRGIKKPALSNLIENTPLDRTASARAPDATLKENESGTSTPLDSRSAGYLTSSDGPKRRKVSEDHKASVSSRSDAVNAGDETDAAPLNSSEQPILLPSTLVAQSSGKDPLFALPKETRDQIFRYCIPPRGVKCWQETVVIGRSQWEHKVLRHVVDKRAVPMLQVSSRWYSEVMMLLYKDVHFVISGNDFVFDQNLMPKYDVRHFQDIHLRPLSYPHSYDTDRNFSYWLEQRLQSKFALLGGRSPSEPSFAPYLRYTQNLTFMIDADQDLRDSTFACAYDQFLRDNHPMPELGDSFSSMSDLTDQHLSEYGEPAIDSNAVEECRGRVQGRIPINFLGMTNVCQMLERYKPTLETIHFELGHSLQKTPFDPRMLPNHWPWVGVDRMGDRQAHLEESLAPFMMTLPKLVVRDITVGPAMKAELTDIQQWRLETLYKDPVLTAQPWYSTLPDCEQLDYRHLFEEIKARALKVKAIQALIPTPQMDDILDLGDNLKNLLESFVPFPHITSLDRYASSWNHAYRFQWDTYDDVNCILRLMDNTPNLPAIRFLRRRVYAVVGPRFQILKDGHDAFMESEIPAGVYPAVHKHAKLKAFLHAFCPEPLWTGADQTQESLPLYVRSSRPPKVVLNRAKAWFNLEKSYNEAGIEFGKKPSKKYGDGFRELRDDLLRQFLKIEQAWDFNQKYDFLDDIGELPRVRAIEYPTEPIAGPSQSIEMTPAEHIAKSKAAAEEREKAAEERVEDKMRRTRSLDSDIQNLVIEGKTQEAWLLLQMLIGETNLFYKNRLPPKPKSTVKVAPIERLFSLPVLKFYMSKAEGPWYEDRLSYWHDGPCREDPTILAREVTTEEIEAKMAVAKIKLPFEVIISIYPDEWKEQLQIESFSMEMIEHAKHKAEQRFLLEEKLREEHRQQLIDEGYGC